MQQPQLKQAKATVVPDSEVFESTEYNVFTFDKRNRPVDQKKVNAFINKFKNGEFFMKEFPGIVQITKDEFVIFDGQHRFEAAKALGLPFYFRYMSAESELTMDKVSHVQSNARWSTLDFLHSNLNVGRPNRDSYVILQRFINRYHLPASTCVNLLTMKKNGEGTGQTLESSGFYDGSFKVTNEDGAHEVLTHAEQFGNLEFKAWTNRSFIIALSIAMRHPEYSKKQMLDRMEKYGASILRRQINVEHFLRNLEELYNYRSNGENKIRFN